MVYEAGFSNASMRVTLGQQMKWLIQLRWIAVLSIVVAGIIGVDVFPILENAGPLFICAAVLLVCNVIYLSVTSKRYGCSEKSDVILAMVQVGIDLVVLTILLHFSGGVQNPFLLFYLFHVIIAAIILPRDLAFCVGLLSIFLYGLIAIGEMKSWFGLQHTSWQLGTTASLWRNPVYVLWSFVAFAITVMLAQFLTRNIITHMRSKEQEAARNHDVLIAVINSMSEGLVYLDAKGKICLCNQEAQRWVSDKYVSVNGVTAGDFPEPLAKFLEELPGILRQGDRTGHTIKFGEIERGENFIEAKARSVIGADSSRLGYVVVGEDLTEHRKLERDLLDRTKEITKINEMLKCSQMEMANREKMVAIGQMASGIAHEIGNPLNSLSAVIQYMKRNLKDKEITKQLDIVTNQIHRISHILKHMLNLSRPSVNECTWVDVNRVIGETLALVQYDERSKGVDVDTDFDDKIPTVWTHRQNLEQVLLNVFLNAFDAINAKVGESKHQLKVVTRLEGEAIGMRISDTGIGVPEEIQCHAFEPFYSTKGTGRGTGLGLYISRNLIEEIKGTITLNQGTEGGACVDIRFPAQIVQEVVDVNPK